MAKLTGCTEQWPYTEKKRNRRREDAEEGGGGRKIRRRVEEKEKRTTPPLVSRRRRSNKYWVLQQSIQAWCPRDLAIVSLLGSYKTSLDASKSYFGKASL